MDSSNRQENKSDEISVGKKNYPETVKKKKKTPAKVISSLLV